MKYKCKTVYSKEHLEEEIKEVKKLGLQFTVFEGVRENRGSYKIMTTEFRYN